MAKEQPKSPLIPTGDVFSASGSDVPPPIAEKPRPISRPQEKIVLNKNDIVDDNSTPKPEGEKKKAEKGKSKQKRGSPTETSSPATQPAAAPTLAKATAKTTAQPAAAIPNAPERQPDSAPKIERAKSPEERADAYATYFTGVKTHGEFLHKIARMTDDSTLRQVVGIAELARVAKKVYHKILAWHAQFEVMKGSAMPVELNTSLEEFAKKLPAAFAMVLRSVTHEEAIAPRIPGTSPIGAKQAEIDRLLERTRTAGEVPAPRPAEEAAPAFSSPAPRKPQTPDEILAAFRAKYPAPAKPPSAPLGTPPLKETAEPPTSASLPAAGPTPERPKTTDEILAAFRARHPAPAGLEKKTLKPMPLAVFEDLVKVDQPTLEKVLAAVGHPKLWGRVLGGLTEEPAMLEFAKEVRAFFARKDKAQANEFDAGVMYIESDASLKMLRRALLINARRALEEEHGTTAETGEKENEKK